MALSSDAVTGTIEALNSSGNVPTLFMLFCVVGIVANVPEHYSAFYMSWKKGDLSLAYATSFGSSGQLIGLILPFLSIISPIPMPILIDPKYLVMLHLSWIVPLTIAYLKLHSVNMGVFMSLIYVACAVVSYVNVSEGVAHH